MKSVSAVILALHLSVRSGENLIDVQIEYVLLFGRIKEKIIIFIDP